MLKRLIKKNLMPYYNFHKKNNARFIFCKQCIFDLFLVGDFYAEIFGFAHNG